MAAVVEQFSARSHARIHALRLLYQREITGGDIEDIIEPVDSACAETCHERACCEYRAFFAQYPTTPDAYTRDIVRGVIAQEDEIDALLDATSEHWPISRMPVVDRNIARIAIWELLRAHPEVPSSVAIHEAVNIAKEYGGDDSALFINGVLGEIDRAVEGGATNRTTERGTS
ncbi:MAG: transcription antitermination factor NusB [Coriobacteriia bacterium]|nr:transcription antitermination factor NusB [Coriobacteriia bacterium]